nr:hypothetical protein [uncultured Mucilaginibacter sp.]
MKQLLAVVLIAFSLQAFSQDYPVKIIKISLPASPDASTANWETGNSYSITAASGEITKNVQVKLLAVIKRDGAIACGAYNSLSSPKISFDAPVKTWDGKNLRELLGVDCTLPPGSYQLSLQFFGYSDGKTFPLSEEKTKPFSINTDNPGNGKTGVNINIGGFGIVIGGGRRQTSACGTITSFTKVVCTGMDAQTGLPRYTITVKTVNKPVDRDQACTFILNTVKSLSKGLVLPRGQALPIKIASGDSAAYAFTYTPPSVNAAEAKFSVTGNWNGDAGLTVEMRPNIKLTPCIACGCGSWANLTVGNASADTSSQFECAAKAQIPWKCGQPFDFSSTYQCAAAAEKCDAVTTWEIQKDGISIKTGSGTNGVKDSFTPTGNGIYTLTLSAACNGLKCPPCVYIIFVEGCNTIVTPPVVTPEVKIVVIEPPVIQVVVEAGTSSANHGEGKYYYDLDTEPTYTVTEIFDKVLNVQFTNSYASVENIKVNIYDSASRVLMKPSAAKGNKTISTSGLNRMSVNLNDYKLEPGRLYLFTVSVFSTHYHLNFKVTGGHEK